MIATAADGFSSVPPDTTLLRWGSVQGPQEQAAFAACAQQIEEAIAYGMHSVGERRWQMMRADITTHTLRSGWLERVHAERIAWWIQENLDALGRRHTTLLAQLRDPVGTPPDPIPTLRWLLERTGRGIELTARNELPPTIVTEAVTRFGWQDQLVGTLHREYDVFPLRHLHDLARDHIHAARRAGRRLELTPLGYRMRSDPNLLHQRAVLAIIGDDRHEPDFGVAAREASLAALLATGPRDGDVLLASVTPQLEAAGWRFDQLRVDEAVRHEIAELRHRLWALDLLYFDGFWTGPITLNEAGTTAVRAALRTRAVRPRHETPTVVATTPTATEPSTLSFPNRGVA
jgi:hypothetical protein